jgi:hypothetical protein
MNIAGKFNSFDSSLMIIVVHLALYLIMTDQSHPHSVYFQRVEIPQQQIAV